METSEQPTLAGFEDESRFYPRACPASRPPLPGSDEAHQMTAGSGRQLSMLLDVSGQLGSFLKTLLESSLWTSSQEFIYVWNRSDTKLPRHSLCQLTPLGQSTDDSGSSLLGTVMTSEGGPNAHTQGIKQTISRLWCTPRNEGFDAGKHNGKADSLHSQAKEPRLWPTPCAQEDGKSPEAHLAMKARMKGGPRKTVTSLTVAAKLWPTPRAEKINGKDREDFSPSLHNFVGQSETSGSLNPRFVEELMGFEIDHTALKRSETHVFPNKRSRSSELSTKSKHV